MKRDQHRTALPRLRRGRGRLAGTALLLALLATGCHSTRQVVTESGGAAPPAPPHRTYTAMTFEGVVEGIAVNGQLRVAEDSAMWVSVTKVIEVGRAMCTPDSLWLRSSLMGRDDAMDYAALRRLTGVDISYDELQQIALAPDAEERIARLAQQLGLTASVRITRRRQADQLSFPYNKTIKP